MTIRGIIKQRRTDLVKIGARAKEDDKQDVMLDCLIRIQELDLLLKQINKRK